MKQTVLMTAPPRPRMKSTRLHCQKMVQTRTIVQDDIESNIEALHVGPKFPGSQIAA